MDKRQQDIAILNDFKFTLQMWNLSHQQMERSKINQMLPKVRKILAVTNSIRYVNIDAPLNMGGQHIVEHGNSLDLIFNAPFNINVSDYIYDSIDSAIGVLSDDEFKYPMEQQKIDKRQEQNNVEGKEVFIVHGHAEAINQEVARTIEKLGLKAIILREQPNTGQTIIEKFESYANKVCFAVILLTADDQMPSEDVFRARQNVIFEMGYFMGALGRHNVMCLLQDKVEKPGDIDGVVYTRIDPVGAWKYSLVKELRACGYAVDANKVL